MSFCNAISSLAINISGVRKQKSSNILNHQYSFLFITYQGCILDKALMLEVFDKTADCFVRVPRSFIKLFNAYCPLSTFGNFKVVHQKIVCIIK